MRLDELMEAVRRSLAANEYLHGSRRKLRLGMVLTPRGEMLAGVDDDIETALEKARPPDLPNRDAVIYMARDLRTLENVARDGDFIYVVQPLSDVLRLDGAWISQVWRLFARHEDDLDNPAIVRQAHRYAEGYWSRQRCPAFQPGHETIWEYMTSQARVVRKF